MEAKLFIKKYNEPSYKELGATKFEVLPRTDELISVQQEGEVKYFQVTAVHHSTINSNVEIYAIQAEPVWEYKSKGNIGFSF